MLIIEWRLPGPAYEDDGDRPGGLNAEPGWAASRRVGATPGVHRVCMAASNREEPARWGFVALVKGSTLTLAALSEWWARQKDCRGETRSTPRAAERLRSGDAGTPGSGNAAGVCTLNAICLLGLFRVVERSGDWGPS